MNDFVIAENGSRRSGIDRRGFSFTAYLPERRSGKDRRTGFNRRSGIERRSLKRSTDDRRKYFTV